MKALVTGGGGFLGGAIVRRLAARGDEVASFSRREHPELERLGVATHIGNLADFAAVARAVEGAEVVFHVGARAGVWGRTADFHRTNVVGTENVIAACRRHGVNRLVYTSSASVVFDGRDQEGADESLPYPRRYLAAYPRSKALAEQRVLAASGAELATVALRPHLVWGPGDNHLVPRVLARSRAGKLRRFRGPSRRVDAVYVENAAAAHLLAADRLAPGSAVAGKVYFIGQGEPIEVWALIDRVLAAGGLPPVARTISPRAAYLMGGLLEVVYRGLGLRGEPPMTRFVARQLGTSQWFDLAAARRDLGYEAEVSLDEGFERLQEYLERQ
ncbi:MAG: NAD-dependent epimerase/dehydratase family protein [Planctomycetes bacterium]|nr:NAD-dependent epimerase/dehydratase family protein [Planctomycetota bacterium]